VAGTACGALAQAAQQPPDVVTTQSEFEEHDARAPLGVLPLSAPPPHATIATSAVVASAPTLDAQALVEPRARREKVCG
jgi:hypothetical protein